MQLLKNIILSIVSPRVGWEEINTAGIKPDDVLSHAYFPLLGVLALTTFVPMIYDSTLTLMGQLMMAICLFVSYFVAYYIGIYLLGGLYPELVKTQGASDRLSDYVVYCLIFLVIMDIIKNLLPIDLTLVIFVKLFMFWMAYRGMEYLRLDDGKRTRFLIFSSLLIFFTPTLIAKCFSLFIP